MSRVDVGVDEGELVEGIAFGEVESADLGALGEGS